MSKSITVRFVGWVIEEDDKEIGGASQRSKAVALGIERAKSSGATLVIQDRDGKVEEQRYYGPGVDLPDTEEK